MHLFPPTTGQFEKVALLMLVLSGVGLVVGSEVSERHRLALNLNERNMYLDLLIENSPLGIAGSRPERLGRAGEFSSGKDLSVRSA